MKIKTFKVERWMNDSEDEAVYNLGETCIDSLTIRELLEIGGYDPDRFMSELADTRLTYSHIFGSPEFNTYTELLERYPGFTITHQKKKNTSSNTATGNLTYEKIEEFIASYEKDKANREATLKEYETLLRRGNFLEQ